MSIAAALCSYLIVTREARLGLNGPQVIEQEAGIEEYDSRNRPFIWSNDRRQKFAPPADWSTRWLTMALTPLKPQ